MGRALRQLRLSIAAIASIAIFVTFSPFVAVSMQKDAGEPTGNLINQVGYLGLAALVVASLIMLVDRKRLLFLLNWKWAVLGAVLLLSMFQAPYFDLAMRGVILSICAMLLTAGIVLVPQTERDFRISLAVGVLLVLALSYGGLVVRPDLAMHSASDPEQHGGLWRGIYSHKNFAGPVMAVFTLFGLYMVRSGERALGLLIAVASAYFVLKTGSKTTAGFLPLSILVVLPRRFFGSTGAVIAGHFVAIAVILTLTVGSAFSPKIENITSYIIEDTTFTGRNDIWRFGAANLPDGLTNSYGYYGFWGSDTPMNREPDPNAAWDVRNMVSGHTNYIDTFLNFGYLPGAIIFILLLVLPPWQYRRACRLGHHPVLADFFMMTVTLMGMISCLETFFFARAMPIWLMMFLAVFGLSCISQKKPVLWPGEVNRFRRPAA